MTDNSLSDCRIGLTAKTKGILNDQYELETT